MFFDFCVSLTLRREHCIGLMKILMMWTMMCICVNIFYFYARNKWRRTFSCLFATRLHCCFTAAFGPIGIFPLPVIPYLTRKNFGFGFKRIVYRAYLEGHANNAHCLAAAVNTVLCALFAIAGRRYTEERLKEFLAVSTFLLIISFLGEKIVIM